MTRSSIHAMLLSNIYTTLRANSADDKLFMPPTLKKSGGGAYCFWLVCSFVRACVRSFVRHAFWCIA